MKHKKTRHLGTIQHGNGRPLDVYGWHRTPNRQHEVKITDIANRYGGDWVRYDTGPEKADWVMVVNGQRYFGEMDTGSISVKTVQKRLLKAYAKCEDLVLFVTSSRKRLDAIRNGLQDLAHIVLYAVFSDVLETPHGDIWTDYYGELTSI